MIERFLGWLGETPWSVALLESLYAWPLVESTHVLALGLFVGTTAMMDLRLVGIAFRKVPITAFTGRLLPWTRIGFAIMTVTGLLLFYSQPLRYYHNVFFRVKVVVLILAGINAAVFHVGAHRKALEWDHDTRPPRGARIAGAVSLSAWAVVVITGRLIAYNWFDCDIQPQPAWVNWLAGCAAVLEGTE
ncbi:MAG: hypothetical protein F4Y24_13515 [Gemmatimonadetes bacterium]|nr:hypothetical protein [Gemmatimonadota bacterium]MYG21589.1 hypothetical protein [Gemmatimonadota bacterium]MYJ37400.1 hypothetical protein [Gemmatimonadota bacterium]